MPDKDLHIESISRIIDSITNGTATRMEAEKELGNLDGSCSPVAKSLLNLVSKLEKSKAFILALSSGKLGVLPPRQNQFIAPFKQLHSDLLHLTWQTQQIAEGDYNQKVSFMGDFSVSFNKMIEALKDRKKLQDNLKESNATKDKFFSIIAHDLINPIGAFVGLTENILENFDQKEKDDLKQNMTAINNSSKSTYSLLQNLLTWSRSQRGTIPFNPNNVDLGFMANQTVNTLKEVAAKKQIDLKSVVEGSLMATCDSQMVTTVIRNLVSNAIKFTPEQGRIEISGYQNDEDQTVTVVVADNGIGIPDENIDKLFRVDKSITTRGTNDEKGTGLGLILCKEFIEKNDGKIWVESELGKGSKFCFTLPLAVQEEVDLSELFS